MNIKPNCITFNVVSQLYPDKRHISYNIRISPASDIFLSSINFKTTAFDVMYLEIRNQFFSRFIFTIIPRESRSPCEIKKERYITESQNGLDWKRP